jgi:hypothetical protein
MNPMNPITVVTGAMIVIALGWWILSANRGREGFAVVGIGLLGAALGWAATSSLAPDWLGSVGLALAAGATGACITMSRRRRSA